jgi:hypothetical protein
MAKCFLCGVRFFHFGLNAIGQNVSRPFGGL